MQYFQMSLRLFPFAEDDAKKKHLFNSSKIRGVIHCQECFKPRCVYSFQKLQWNERVLLKDVANEKLYTCGSPLFIPDSPVVETIVVRQNIGCSNPMESQLQCQVAVIPTCMLLLWTDGGVFCWWCSYKPPVVQPFAFSAQRGKLLMLMPTNVRKCPWVD